MISHWEMILRVAFGAFLGGAIGFERDRHRRQAGLRTHFLVGLASATFMVVSAHFYFFQHYGNATGIAADPSRIAASVVAGIGFLAGGAILKTGLTVQGLTTAAGLWLVASIGLCAGAGMYWEAFVVTALGLLALTLFRIFESKSRDVLRREVTVTLSKAPGVIPELLGKLSEAGAKASEFDFDRTAESSSVKISFEAEIPIRLGISAFLNLVEECPGVLGIQVRRV
ncbi:MAG: MgtC/SapB family protein [Geothrix sp.]|nr:MgtC/SapB family protein [Geothrix sp.]